MKQRGNRPSTKKVRPRSEKCWGHFASGCQLF